MLRSLAAMNVDQLSRGIDVADLQMQRFIQPQSERISAGFFHSCLPAKSKWETWSSLICLLRKRASERLLTDGLAWEVPRNSPDAHEVACIRSG